MPLRYIARRLLLTIPTLFGVVLLVFLMAHAIPGSPWSSRSERRAMAMVSMDDTTQAHLDRTFGLDLPVWRQFLRYTLVDFDAEGKLVCGLVCGSLGPSYRVRGYRVEQLLFDPPENKSVWESRFWYSLRLILISTIVSTIIGILLGLAAAFYHNTWLDRLLSVLVSFSMGVPNFVTGLVLLFALSVGLGMINVLPNWEKSSDWILPVFVLAIVPAGAIARVTRAAQLEALGNDYVRTARAKGAPLIYVRMRHAFRNALLPIVTLLGSTTAELLAGSFVVENMFGFPGFGREYWLSITSLDYSMIIGVTLIYASLIIFSNLLVDLLYGWLDPRVHLE